MNEEQQIEWEVLESIYSIDENYKKVSDNRLQYKFGTDSAKTFLLEIEWPADYPNIVPALNLDVFYNTHISGRVRQAIKDKLLEVAKENEGMAVSFTIIEFAKEHFDELTADWETATPANEAIGTLVPDIIEEKPEVMTKAAKRRMWNRNEGTGHERGWNWVDIVKHLSQIKDNI